MKKSLLALSIGLAVSLNAWAGPQDLLPPAPEWHGDSEKLIAPHGDAWETPAEKLGLNDTPNYADTMAYLQKLVEASPLLEMKSFGKTAQGRELVVVIASKAGAFDSASLKAAGKPTLLAQAGIHAGEIDGKDAGLMLLRDIAFNKKDELLDDANFLFVPIFNADGHERISEWNRPNQRGPVNQGWRTTAQNLNLNRDYIKADAPETRAMLGLINEWQPELYIDLHVTDGIDYQYDITWGYNGHEGKPSYSPKIAQWLEKYFSPAVTSALKGADHIPGPLVFARNNRDLSEGLDDGQHTPRFSAGYGDLRHMPSVLIENHSLKPYKQRVLGNRVLLEEALDVLGKRAKELRAAIAFEQGGRPASIPMNWTDTEQPAGERDFLGVSHEKYASPASGIEEVRWTGKPETLENLKFYRQQPAVQLSRPKAYWVPATKPEVIERLRAHGIAMEQLKAPTTVKLEMYRVVDAKPSATPFEGRNTLNAKLKKETREEWFPAGSVRVSTDQALGDLLVVMMEPKSNDSLFAWGFFPEILQRTEYVEGYVIAPMAEKALADDPKLKADFEAKLAADPAFAKDPQARLSWFYERSKFYDQRYLLYPVGREL
ncbi:MAG: M14 family metallopeptidase [Gammaproteobacteria bacterium]|nr:M14 family metallopeptidase [Gammaproteobacteria bacterium]